MVKENNLKVTKRKEYVIRKISIIITIIMLLQIILPGINILNSSVMADNPEEYYIGTEQELWNFANEVNEGNTFDGTTVYLTEDINLNCTKDNQWLPIGRYKRKREKWI